MNEFKPGDIIVWRLGTRLKKYIGPNIDDPEKADFEFVLPRSPIFARTTLINDHRLATPEEIAYAIAALLQK